VTDKPLWQRLSDHRDIEGDTPTFVGAELLPEEILGEWSHLSLDARAIAILFAKALHEENESRLDRQERW
jgi:hypothetical protein